MKDKSPTYSKRELIEGQTPQKDKKMPQENKSTEKEGKDNLRVPKAESKAPRDTEERTKKTSQQENNSEQHETKTKQMDKKHKRNKSLNEQPVRRSSDRLKHKDNTSRIGSQEVTSDPELKQQILVYLNKTVEKKSKRLEH